uniref:Pyroglutamyl-peptidase I n=1 Tax=Phocoena sinus TaxID=42100 RepID=A0A8C9BIA9_PHOSS
MEHPRKAVVVTGFGPFGEHAVNASWIAVQELEKLGLGDSVDLHVYEIPVEYKTVQRLIPALWEKHSPQILETSTRRKRVTICCPQAHRPQASWNQKVDDVDSRLPHHWPIRRMSMG